MGLTRQAAPRTFSPLMQDKTPSTTPSVAKSALSVSGATLLSRVLGLLRDQIFAALFGASAAADAFNMAFRVPNLLRDLFAEGAMSASFVPTFQQWREREGDEAAWGLGRQLMATLVVTLSALCMVGWLLMPQLIGLMAGGFAAVPGKVDLTVLLARIMLPFLPAVALAAAASGMLNARGVFGVPALAPTMLNVGMIVFGLGLIPVMNALGQPAVVAMAAGVSIGGLLQFLCQLPRLRQLGFSLRPELLRWHPGVRRVALLMLPATLGLAATQLNVVVSQAIAASFREGSVSWLQYAFRLMQLPIGLFGVAVATVSLPALSAAAIRNDLGGMRATLSEAVRLVILLTVPSAVFLAVMGGPIIGLLFERGRFHAGDTAQTAGALTMYCVGLPAFAAVGTFTRAFYALGETRTPVRASLVAVAVNLALNFLFVGPLRHWGLDHRGLALANSVTSLANLALLALLLRGRLGGIDAGRMGGALFRVGTASLTAGTVLTLALRALPETWGDGWPTRLATVVGGALVGLVVGYGVLRLLRAEELELSERLTRAVRRRFGR